MAYPPEQHREFVRGNRMTKEELCRLEQSELVKLIDEGQLVYLPCDDFNYTRARQLAEELGVTVGYIHLLYKFIVKPQKSESAMFEMVEKTIRLAHAKGL